MNVAKACRAEEVRVKLCFLVNVLNARGRNVAGGRRIGRILAFTGAAVGLKARTGYAGVPKAGDEEGIGFNGAGVGGGLNIGAARGFSVWPGRDILSIMIPV
jgi:hypothetical protein